MGARKRSRSPRFRVGKVSGYLHHGAWSSGKRRASRATSCGMDSPARLAPRRAGAARISAGSCSANPQVGADFHKM